MARSKLVYRLIISSFSSGIYHLARLSHLPLARDFIHWLLFRENHIVYLPTDRVVPINQAVPEPENMVLPSEVIDYFIKKAKNRFIMAECLCRAGCECADYPRDFGCLFLGEAAAQINPRLGRMVSEDEALDHIRKCREAGLVQMIGRDRLDSVALDIGPDDRLMTICNCCPCCCIWRILPLSSAEINKQVVKMPGVELRVTDRCMGCETCIAGTCFVDAIRMDGDHASIGPDCRGCGRCVEVCPEDAIEISFKDPRTASHVIDQLERLVDVS